MRHIVQIKIEDYLLYITQNIKTSLAT